jgi:hypothetical protein
MADRVVSLVSWAALGVLVVLALAAVATQRRGSLDDLSANEIQQAVQHSFNRGALGEAIKRVADGA